MTRWHIVLTGRVQGVGLRFRARMIAQQYHLTGWICNQSDGSVELELQGEQHSIDRCLEQIRTLPGVRANIVHVEELSPVSEKQFRIRM